MLATNAFMMTTILDRSAFSSARRPRRWLSTIATVVLTCALTINVAAAIDPCSPDPIRFRPRNPFAPQSFKPWVPQNLAEILRKWEQIQRMPPGFGREAQQSMFDRMYQFNQEWRMLQNEKFWPFYEAPNQAILDDVRAGQNSVSRLIYLEKSANPGEVFPLSIDHDGRPVLNDAHHRFTANYDSSPDGCSRFKMNSCQGSTFAVNEGHVPLGEVQRVTSFRFQIPLGSIRDPNATLSTRLGMLCKNARSSNFLNPTLNLRSGQILGTGMLVGGGVGYGTTETLVGCGVPREDAQHFGAGAGFGSGWMAGEFTAARIYSSPFFASKGMGGLSFSGPIAIVATHSHIMQSEIVPNILAASEGACALNDSPIGNTTCAQMEINKQMAEAQMMQELSFGAGLGAIWFGLKYYTGFGPDCGIGGGW